MNKYYANNEMFLNDQKQTKLYKFVELFTLLTYKVLLFQYFQVYKI